MLNPSSVAPTHEPLGPFLKGQIYRIGDVNLAVTMVGKTLVHYRKYKTQPRGAQITLTSKLDLQKYLVSNKAILVSE